MDEQTQEEKEFVDAKMQEQMELVERLSEICDGRDITVVVAAGLALSTAAMKDLPDEMKRAYVVMLNMMIGRVEAEIGKVN